jgi:triosephosphate isomerase
VIVGHSERRELFGETDEFVREKVQAVLEAGMQPILCVGETLEEREGGETDAKVRGQIAQGLAGISGAHAEDVVVAYEPIWAIGTGRNATAEDANATIATIRSQLRETVGGAAETVRILYGGSVKPGNAAELMAQPEIDGALVGGASLDPDDFARIIQYGR